MGMLGGGLYATDALTAGTVYDKPYQQAYEELVAMPLLPVTGIAEPGSGSMVVERAPGKIGWRISVGQMEVGRFTASLSPVGGNRTRVLIDFATIPAEAGQNPILTSKLMTEFARLAMVEQVDARMENRAPDIREMQWSMARHIQANPAQMREFGGAIDAQFKEVDKMLRENSADTTEFNERLRNIEISYAPPPRPEDATRPAVTFDK